MRRTVPFYENSDNTHCYQACIKMILKYFEPERDDTWDELDHATAKVDGLWTWPMAGMVWLQSRGYALHNVEDFDYRQFIEKGEQYLIERSGEAVARQQITHSDIEQEYKYAHQLVEKIPTDVRIPNIADLLPWLNKGYLLVCNVNSRALNQLPGYAGHFVLVIGHTEGALLIHDPGPPGIQSRQVPYSIFEQAWAYPNAAAKNFFAVRR